MPSSPNFSITLLSVHGSPFFPMMWLDGVVLVVWVAQHLCHVVHLLERIFVPEPLDHHVSSSLDVLPLDDNTVLRVVRPAHHGDVHRVSRTSSLQTDHVVEAAFDQGVHGIHQLLGSPILHVVSEGLLDHGNLVCVSWGLVVVDEGNHGRGITQKGTFVNLAVVGWYFLNPSSGMPNIYFKGSG